MAKESYQGVNGLPTPPGEGPPWGVVGDAKGHSYAFLDGRDDQPLDFIVRAADARRFTEDDPALFEAVAQQPLQAPCTLSLKRRPDRAPRAAQMERRFGRVTLKRPPPSREPTRHPGRGGCHRADPAAR